MKKAQDPVVILRFEIENVKRVALVRYSPDATGLTVIGGDNAQGKTSNLDALCFGLGGAKYKPTNLKREGGSADPSIHIELSNGLVVERKGKNASLTVTDPTGQRFGQSLLDGFIEELALNLPKFLNMTAKDKAGVLLAILGIEDQLKALQAEEDAAYNERTTTGRIADQKAKYAKELPEHHDVPDVPVTTQELVKEAQAVMARNAERANARRHKVEVRALATTLVSVAEAKKRRIEELKKMLADVTVEWGKAQSEATHALADADQAEDYAVPEDEDTAVIEQKMADIETINAKVRQNLDKRKANDDAEEYQRQYDALTAKVEDVRARRMALLAGCNMPIPGLSVENAELTYNGKAWDCMSKMEQVRAGIAIVKSLKPACGFVLLDGLELFDLAQLGELNEYLHAEKLQGIGTRVSRGPECSIIIEDGMVVETGPVAAPPKAVEAEW